MSYQTEEQLPFFVYGTLRPGQSNFHLLDGRTRRIRPASVTGFGLYSLGAYPILFTDDNPRARVVGDLVMPTPQYYTRVMKALDRLEEYDPSDPEGGLYQRIPHQVRLHGRKRIRAWLYLGRPEHLFMKPKRIHHGDWAQYCEQNSVMPFTGLYAN